MYKFRCHGAAISIKNPVLWVVETIHLQVGQSPQGLVSTANGTYNNPAPTVAAQQVIIVGIGTETGNDGSAKVKVTATVTSTKVSVVVNN